MRPAGFSGAKVVLASPNDRDAGLTSVLPRRDAPRLAGEEPTGPGPGRGLDDRWPVSPSTIQQLNLLAGGRIADALPTHPLQRAPSSRPLHIPI